MLKQMDSHSGSATWQITGEFGQVSISLNLCLIFCKVGMKIKTIDDIAFTIRLTGIMHVKCTINLFNIDLLSTFYVPVLGAT